MGLPRKNFEREKNMLSQNGLEIRALDGTAYKQNLEIFVKKCFVLISRPGRNIPPI